MSQPKPNRRYESLDTDHSELREFHRTQTEHNGAVNEIAKVDAGATLPEGNHTFAQLEAFHRQVAAKQEALAANPDHTAQLDFTDKRPKGGDLQNGIRSVGGARHQGSPIPNGVSRNRNNQPKPKPTPNRQGANPASDAKAGDALKAENKPRKNSERTGSVDVSVVPR